MDSPCDCISASCALRKSPGGSWMMTKVMMLIAISVGIITRMRRITYRSTHDLPGGPHLSRADEVGQPPRASAGVRASEVGESGQRVSTNERRRCPARARGGFGGTDPSERFGDLGGTP